MSALNPFLAGVEAPPVAVVQGWAAEARVSAERPLLDLAQAAPGWPMAEALVGHVSARLADPAFAGYAPILGFPELRAALAAETAALYGGEIAAAHVAITSGCNQAFVVAAMALASAGDAVMLPTPWYFNHKMTLDMLGVEAIPLPCDPVNGMLPDADAAARLLTPKTRAIVLVTPNNPTGAIYDDQTIGRFLDLADAAGVRLILDETYRDFLSGRDAPHSGFRRPDWPRRLVHLYSFSKAYAMPGLRVGAVVAGEDVVASVQKALDSIAICASQPGQAAAAFGIAHLAGWREEKRLEMNARLAAFETAMAPLRNEFPILSAGGFFAYCGHPFGGPAMDAAKRLIHEAGLMAMPGSAFGPGQEDRIRFAFGNIAPERAAEVGERLRLLL